MESVSNSSFMITGQNLFGEFIVKPLYFFEKRFKKEKSSLYPFPKVRVIILGTVISGKIMKGDIIFLLCKGKQGYGSSTKSLQVDNMDVDVASLEDDVGICLDDSIGIGIIRELSKK